MVAGIGANWHHQFGYIITVNRYSSPNDFPLTITFNACKQKRFPCVTSIGIFGVNLSAINTPTHIRLPINFGAIRIFQLLLRRLFDDLFSDAVNSRAAAVPEKRRAMLASASTIFCIIILHYIGAALYAVTNVTVTVMRAKSSS